MKTGRLEDRKAQRPFQLLRNAGKSNIKDVLKVEKLGITNWKTTELMPPAGPRLPSPQGWQVDASVAAACSEKYPGGHASQSSWLCSPHSSEYVPRGHCFSEALAAGASGELRRRGERVALREEAEHGHADVV